MTAPTLIIGLGGIGSEIVSMVEEKAKISKSDISNVKFIIIDTDNGALLKEKRNGFEGTTIRISNNITVESCLQMNNLSREWYPRNQIFMNKTLTDGAGQVRAISRLALEHAVLQGLLEPLTDDIMELHWTQKNPDYKTLRIAVVSSLAGGTGSGLILPFAIYLSDYLKKNFEKNGYNMSGFFMMPDIILKGSEKNYIERISLNSNAYATIKELDDFIQRSVGTLDVKAEIKLVNGRRRNPDTALYNFNFLFGLLNNDEGYSGLRTSMEYKRMMADCIFVPYCSPINEENTSWEDNKFKHLSIMLTKDEGVKQYRHFGSIGVASMVYPYDDVRFYLTMVWAKDLMSDKWFHYDLKYEEELGKHNEMQKKGLIGKAFTKKGEFYRKAVESDIDAFSKDIKDDLTVLDIDAGTSMLAYEAYMKSLEEFIQAEVKNIVDKDFMSIEKANKMTLRSIARVNKLFGFRKKKAFNSLYRDRYGQMHKISNQIIYDVKKKMANYLFQPHSYMESKGKAYLLEAWIFENQRGDFVSPNAVRYFLEEACVLMKERAYILGKSVKDRANKHEAVQSQFKIAAAYNWNELTIRIKRLREDYEAVIREEVFLYCLQVGVKRVRNLADAYEKLFDDYRKGMEQLDERRELLKSEMQAVEGTRVKKVGCQEEYLNEMYNEMKKESSIYYGTLNKVYQQIYEMANEYAVDSNTNNGKGSSKWDTLLNQWKENFEDAYGSKFNVDVLSALEQEIRWNIERKNNGKPMADKAVKARMEEELERCATQLAAPFMSTALDPYKTVILENYFHSSLLKLKGIKKEIVLERLIAKNGIEESQMIDKYTINFYQSLFGVHAKYLKPFKQGEECYKDYDDITKYMHINGNREQILTPHLDRTWHRIDILPEIDPDIQVEKQKYLWVVLFYSYIMGRHIIKDNDAKYNIKDLALEHKQCSSLYDVMEIFKNCREDADKVFGEMDAAFSGCLIQTNSYKEDEFYKNYEKCDVITDIYLAYVCPLNETWVKGENVAEWFVLGWQYTLEKFLEKYTNVYESTMKKMMNDKIHLYKSKNKAKNDNMKIEDAIQKLDIALHGNGLARLKQ